METIDSQGNTARLSGIRCRIFTFADRIGRVKLSVT